MYEIQQDGTGEPICREAMERNCSFNYQNIKFLEIKLLKYKDTVSHLQSYDLKIGNTATEVDAQKKVNNYLKKTNKKKCSP